MNQANRFIEQLITAAENHGRDSEPDHEVGDLQDLVRDLWKQMTLKQRQTFMQREDYADRVVMWCDITSEQVANALEMLA